MAFVVPTRPGRFEIRESRSTPRGSRSRTLASFKELNPAVIEKALARASNSLDPEQLRKSALRAGAPIAEPAVEQAGRETLRLLARGERLDPMLRQLLLDALRGEDPPSRDAEPAPPSDAARAATEWIGATPGERGEALEDLLKLTDALPLRRRAATIGFPRLGAA